VTLVTPESSILPEEDYEVSQRLKSILGEYGVQVLSGATLKSTARQGSQVSAVISQRKGESTLVVDRILWSAFAPAIEGLGLESAGVKVVDGAVKVDNRCQTNVPSIYAIGDLTGKPLYSYVATVQGLVAAENALGKNRRIDLRLTPRCIYTVPEAACVGLTETEAEDQGYDVQIVNISQQTSVRAMTREEAVGGIKVVFDRKTSKILGVHIVGYRATDLIGEAALALQLEVLADDFAWAMRGHPTLCESMVEAGRAFYKQALYIPKM
jgi:dihydrolipoamide dehydrogenase